MPTIAIIGAGAAGLSAARRLSALGGEVRVFDKGRRAGGRIASRETAFGSFDHGAQFLRAAGEPDRALLAPLLQAGTVADWPAFSDADAEVRPARLAVPTMNTLAQAWAEGLALQCGVTVTAVLPAGARWQLQFDGARTPERFDAVLVTVPAPQAATLLPAVAEAAALGTVGYAPCWTLLWAPEAALPEDLPFLRGDADDAIAWCAREDLKPGRAGPPRLTVQASAAWTRAQLELPADEAAARLVELVARRFGIPTGSRFRLAHRWRYAFVEQPLGLASLTLAPRLGYAGDACLGSRIELAAASGRAAAEALAAQLG